MQNVLHLLTHTPMIFGVHEHNLLMSWRGEGKEGRKKGKANFKKLIKSFKIKEEKKK